ncbi:hypothetical protein LMG28688_01707 [Paraburkholderia caffeinitolerans]|uniref:Uncharacterized protein n=1 Tax=Paraburkholderia caffeinitolerans TaxID=1723730 RepID=A0A6J5FN28_9BURK|nr:hypothetical protein [Paraburkholderia caffeinitolerans]CAB3783730.1 hypothetical protein LMG28688_01707 [Paraburkholderia caffeinitolerans]
MSFALLLSKLPQVELARSHYTSMLALHEPAPSLTSRLWKRLKRLCS